MKLIWIPGISSKRSQWAFARHYYHEYVNSNRAHSIDICFFLLAHLSVVSAILLDFIRRCNWMQFYVRRAQVTRNKPSTITQSAKYAFQWFECHWIVSVWTGFALHAQLHALTMMHSYQFVLCSCWKFTLFDAIACATERVNERQCTRLTATATPKRDINYKPKCQWWATTTAAVAAAAAVEIEQINFRVRFMCTVHVALVVDECYLLTHLRLAKTIIYAMTEAQKQNSCISYSLRAGTQSHSHSRSHSRSGRENWLDLGSVIDAWNRRRIEQM